MMPLNYSAGMRADKGLLGGEVDVDGLFDGRLIPEP